MCSGIGSRLLHPGMQMNFGQLSSYKRTDTKQTGVRGGTELSGRNTNAESVGKGILRTRASDIRETGGEQFAVDSLVDWKPADCLQKLGKYGLIF